jgi:hypothetical protein
LPEEFALAVAVGSQPVGGDELARGRASVQDQMVAAADVAVPAALSTEPPRRATGDAFRPAGAPDPH